MKFLIPVVVWVGVVLARRTDTLSRPKVADIPARETNSLCSTVKLDSKTNIWKNYTLHQNPFYTRKVLAAAEIMQDQDLQERASKVANVGNFVWL